MDFNTSQPSSFLDFISKSPPNSAKVKEETFLDSGGRDLNWSGFSFYGNT